MSLSLKSTETFSNILRMEVNDIVIKEHWKIQ